MEFFKAKQKKMNFEMMMLADCVPLFAQQAEAGDLEARRDLVKYVKSIGEVGEVRAVAYHDLASLSQPSTETETTVTSNLYKAWY